MPDKNSTRGERPSLPALIASKRILLACFTPESDAASCPAKRFLREVSEANGGKVAVACITRRSEPRLAHEYASGAVLTLVLFVGGKAAARSVGGGGETMMRRLIELHVGAGGKAGRDGEPRGVSEKKVPEARGSRPCPSHEPSQYDDEQTTDDEQRGE